MSDRYGPRLIASAGFLLACPFLILLRLPSENTTSDKVVFCVLLTLIGAAMAMIMSPIMAEFTHVVFELEKERPGRFGTNGAFAQAVSNGADCAILCPSSMPQADHPTYSTACSILRLRGALWWARFSVGVP